METKDTLTETYNAIAEPAARIFNNAVQGRGFDAASLHDDFKKIGKGLSELGFSVNGKSFVDMIGIPVITVSDGKENRCFALSPSDDKNKQIARMSEDIIKKQMADFFSILETSPEKGAKIHVESEINRLSLGECLGRAFAEMPVGEEISQTILEYINTGSDTAFEELKEEIMNDLPSWMGDIISRNILPWKNAFYVDIEFPDGKIASRVFLAKDTVAVREWLEKDLAKEIGNPSIIDKVVSGVEKLDRDPSRSSEMDYNVADVRIYMRKSSARAICADKGVNLDIVMNVFARARVPKGTIPIFASHM